MKKISLTVSIVLVIMTACNDTNKPGETTESVSADTMHMTEAQRREKEIDDSTKMLDKKLADPNSTYSPDSLK